MLWQPLKQKFRHIKKYKVSWKPSTLVRSGNLSRNYRSRFTIAGKASGSDVKTTRSQDYQALLGRTFPSIISKWNMKYRSRFTNNENYQDAGGTFLQYFKMEYDGDGGYVKKKSPAFFLSRSGSGMTAGGIPANAGIQGRLFFTKKGKKQRHWIPDRAGHDGSEVGRK